VRVCRGWNSQSLTLSAHYTHNRHVLSFPSLQRGRIFQLKSQSLPSLANSLAVGLVAPLCYFLLFVASYLSSSSSASPTTGAHSLPRLLPLSFRVLLHVYATAVVVVFTQRMVFALMHIIHTQWVSFEGRGGGVGAEGDVVVPALDEEIKVSTTPGEEWKEYKAGATSLMGALALMELSGLVRTSPRRRARIFADHTGTLALALASGIGWVVFLTDMPPYVHGSPAQVELGSRFWPTRSVSLTP
jgi:hypothetical protein